MTKTHKLYEVALQDRLPVIAYGSAGTGKTCGAVGEAVQRRKAYKTDIIVTRPNVSFADKNGFVPGTEREKMGPWIRPIEQNFKYHGIGKNVLESWEKKGGLQYYPLEYIQGLTFDNSFIIVDECQNMSLDQLKVFLTRTGKWSKVVLCGDIAQVSPKFNGSGLRQLLDMIEEYELPVNTIEFTKEDILRSDQCKMWIEAFENWENKCNRQ